MGREHHREARVKEFWICFVPLFVAVDAVGVLPIFLGLSRDLNSRDRSGLIVKSVISATLVAELFILFGKDLLEALGITMADFMVAGGAVLFFMSIGDLVRLGSRVEGAGQDDWGVVPLGVPLIAGPAVLTTAVLQREIHGLWLAMGAMAANTLLAGVVFWLAKPINRILGQTGAKIVSKIASLFLAAIGVMLVRRGVMYFATGGG
jgi:multiple antibiotic resistance protein